MPEEKKHNVALQHKTVHFQEHDYMFSDSTKMLFFFFPYCNVPEHVSFESTTSISCICEN